MAASMKSLLLLGLVVASICLAADATNTPTPTPPTPTPPTHPPPTPTPGAGGNANLNVKVALQLNLKKCASDVTLFVGGDVKVCAGGALTVLAPVAVKLDVADLLVLYVKVGNSAAKVKVVVDLRTASTVVGGVHRVVLDLVENVRTRKLDVLCLGVRLTVLDLLKLNIGLNL